MYATLKFNSTFSSAPNRAFYSTLITMATVLYGFGEQHNCQSNGKRVTLVGCLYLFAVDTASELIIKMAI